MALNDMRDKLATAEDYLLHKPFCSREWDAAWEHVSWMLAHGDNAEQAAVHGVLSRLRAARWEHGLREKIAAVRDTERGTRNDGS